MKDRPAATPAGPVRSLELPGPSQWKRRVRREARAQYLTPFATSRAHRIQRASSRGTGDGQERRESGLEQKWARALRPGPDHNEKNGMRRRLLGGHHHIIEVLIVAVRADSDKAEEDGLPLV